MGVPGNPPFSVVAGSAWVRRCWYEAEAGKVYRHLDRASYVLRSWIGVFAARGGRVVRLHWKLWWR